MRIGYLVSQYPATSHTFIRREIAALRTLGWDVDTFSVRKPSEAERRSPIARAEYEQTWYALPPRPDIVLALLSGFVRHPVRFMSVLVLALRHRVPGVRSFVWSWFYFAEAMYLATELRRRRIDHLHNHFGNAGAIVGMLATRYLGITWSLSMHAVSEFDYPYGPLLGEKIHAATFGPCCAHFAQAQAMRFSDPKDWHKLFVTRCGLELDRLRAMAPERTRASTRPRILCVARFSPEKGVDGLLHAFSKLQQLGVDAELRIVGDGPYAGALRAQARALGIEERCTFTGRLPEEQVPAEYANADIFAMASLMEGLPVVLMEALALGVPVVAPGLAGIPELVQHDVTGLLYRPSDWDDMAAQLALLAGDPALRSRLARAGQKLVEEEFEISRAVAPLHERLEQLRDEGR